MKLNLVKASTGTSWVRQGVRTFWRQPIALGGLFFIFISLMSVFAIVPRIGNVLAIVCIPAASLGLMQAASLANQGQFPMPGVLFSAFRAAPERRQQMLVLGILYAGAFVGVLGLSSLFDGGVFAQLYLFGGRITPELVNTPGFETAMWFCTLLYVPVSATFWHAPALVHWHGVPAFKSLFFSLMACFTNWRAFGVYLLTWTAISMGFSFSLIVVMSLFDLNALSGATLIPALLVLAAMFFTSSFFSYRDCFEPQVNEQA
jgi:hypothetical protein